MFKSTHYPAQIDLSRGRDALSRKVMIAVLLGIALVSFEVFNFDTTKFALANLMGDIRFAGVAWASILAVAFCAIDFAGLVRLFTPERGAQEPKAVWFLTGAWFLGTIANSVLTWWAVSLTLLSHDFGNEVLSREALLRYVPIFVAMLVWLTRILFIGAFSVAGENALDLARAKPERDLPVGPPRREIPAGAPVRAAAAQQRPAAGASAESHRANNRPTPTKPPQKQALRPARPIPAAQSEVTYEPVDDPFDVAQAPPKTNGVPTRPTSRIRQRPPMPGGMGRPTATGNVHASPRSSRSGH